MPVAGFPGVMSESDNSYHLAICYRHNGERESLKNKSFCSQPGSFANHGYKRRVWFTEPGCCLLKRIDQLISKTADFQLIPRGGLNQFFGSFRANLYLQNQLLIRVLARAMASSASKSSVLPDSMSLILRQISVSQASAALISAVPSKLATKSCASFARSRSGRVIAAFVILSSWAIFIVSTKSDKVALVKWCSKIHPITRPSTATAFPFRLRLHYKAARVGGVRIFTRVPIWMKN